MENRGRRNELVVKTMTYNKTCAYCGKEFISNRKNGRFCSPECYKNHSHKMETERYRRKKAEADERVKVNKNLVETIQKARDMGMSYGQ